MSPLDIGKAAGKETSAVLVRLADVAAEDVEWLWKNRIALGKLTLIVGDVGVGKTYLTTDIAARVTQGTGWPDGAPSGDPSHVIILTSEDGIADTLRPRLDRQGGDPTRVDVLRAVQLGDRDGESAFNLERDLPALEGAIVATQARVVVADPLSAYLGTKDSYKDAEIRGLLTPLADLAERRRVAILGLLHLTKAQQRRILHRVQASIAFVAQARTVLAVGEDPDTGRRLVAPLKNNLGPLPPCSRSASATRAYGGSPASSRAPPRRSWPAMRRPPGASAKSWTAPCSSSRMNSAMGPCAQSRSSRTPRPTGSRSGPSGVRKPSSACQPIVKAKARGIGCGPTPSRAHDRGMPNPATLPCHRVAA